MGRMKLTRVAFASMVALALGFGAEQALAAPTAGASSDTCDPQVCNRICRALGTIGGTCINGGCSCYIGR